MDQLLLLPPQKLTLIFSQIKEYLQEFIYYAYTFYTALLGGFCPNASFTTGDHHQNLLPATQSTLHPSEAISTTDSVVSIVTNAGPIQSHR
jgi:hypothetical protein